MLDPFPVPPLVRDAIQPLADLLHLGTLPLHAHEVLAGFALYTFIDSVLSPAISARLLPSTYAKFSARTKLNWNMHVTSFVNATFLSVAASYVLYYDAERLHETWEQRIWGYTGAGAMVQAFGAGYFLWDLQMCAMNVRTLGVLDLLHAIVGLAISILGFRPFGLYYGIQYALIELSTPFVNIHWFLNKLGRAGSKLQIVNGAILIVVFASCRLVLGTYLTIVFSRDAWSALHAPAPGWTKYDYSPGQEPIVLQHEAAWWLVAAFLISNGVVMSLSAFWFTKMIATVGRHMSSATEEKKFSHD
ncbi:TLC domain-containing protein [Pyrenochaeta sp. MPI-SDFR-AT-0127]|nr:TLC domain-containing protein [Pyrenochaeta sp. MPI-SDFR-AT-0127]